MSISLAAVDPCASALLERECVRVQTGSGERALTAAKALASAKFAL